MNYGNVISMEPSIVIAFLLIPMIIGIIYYIAWERRIIERSKRVKKIEKGLERIEKAVREYAKTEPRLAEILRSMRLM